MDLKKKIENAKNKVKYHVPEAAFATIAVAAATYAVILKNRSSERLPEGGTTYLALNEESMKMLQEGNNPYWTIDGHNFNLAYDPDC